ncbi:Dual 3',5'-cyclic-AMP and -GMP phosphodiesterase 11A [Nymphon striatum]|nr:Dual 3',5'-cyclic-AMP and -GMP phosphodiesterase 11A [Nymphon striatum]
MTLPSRVKLAPYRKSKVQLPECHHRPDKESKSKLRQIDEKDFFLEIVKDIANDLDLRSMTQKITENLSLLLNADGASLFIVEGTHGNKTLSSKIFDIHTGTNILPTNRSDNCVQVPWGTGFIGHVAKTGDTVNVINACENERYNDEVDRITGYKTDSLLCMPVMTVDDEITAVAQVINKNPALNGRFTKADEKVKSNVSRGGRGTLQAMDPFVQFGSKLESCRDTSGFDKARARKPAHSNQATLFAKIVASFSSGSSIQFTTSGDIDPNSTAVRYEDLE